MRIIVMSNTHYYWTSGGSAEVDFIVQHKDCIFPVEVKSGFSKHKKSLISFKEKYNPPACLRLSTRDFYREKDFINVPLYAACLLDNLLSLV